jgi:hypothetical protein
MNKLKMTVLTALAATVGVGALASAPSASAMPARDAICADLASEAEYYGYRAEEAQEWGWTWLAAYYNRLAADDIELYKDMCE